MDNMYISPFNPNRDFDLGFHAFRTFPLALSTLFDHEFDSFSRRFKVTEKGEGFELVLDLPGFKSSDLDVQLEKSILTVRAKNESDEVENSITVGNDIDPEKVDAVLENGRLVITLSKRESAKPRKVIVK
jgi:HSP20 family molecular chaperone IbpA